MSNEARLNPRAMLEKNRPPGGQVVRVIKLADDLSVIPQPQLAFVPNQETGELELYVAVVALRESAIVGASQPVAVPFAKIGSMAIEDIRRAVIPDPDPPTAE